MRVFLVFLTFLVLPFGALAQEQGMSSQPVCKVLAKHTPRDDVAYKPGVDVRGKAVVPADLNDGNSLGLGEQPIRIPLELDLAQRFGVAPDVNGLDTKPDIGFMDIFPDGRVEINGRDVTDAALDVCSEAISTRTRQAQRAEPEPQSIMPYPDEDRQAGGGSGVPVSNGTVSNIPATNIDEIQAKPPGRPEPLQPMKEETERRQRRSDRLDLGRPIDGVYYNE